MSLLDDQNRRLYEAARERDRLLAKVTKLESALCERLISSYGLWQDGAITKIMTCECGARVMSKDEVKRSDLMHNIHCPLDVAAVPNESNGEP